MIPMPPTIENRSRRHWQCASVILLATATMSLISPRAFALITGGEGNTPIKDPGWPNGAAAIFNTQSRIAWWEGPPFGGGEWHSECRGDAKALNEVLAGFAKLDQKNKRVVVHDGVGHSFWLNPNREPAKRDAAMIDWVFLVWQPDNWNRLRKMPADLNPTSPGDAEKGPPAQIDIFTGGSIRWAEVIVSKGLEVADQRLEAHGFTTADGIVLEGKVFDLTTHRPVAGRVKLQLIEPQAQGGYRYTVKAETAADAVGRWVIKNSPVGWYRVVVEAAGYVPKIVGYAQFDEQPLWQFYDCGIAQAAAVSGRVTDDAGKPLEGVEVRLSDVVPSAGGRYESPNDYQFKTDADGRFQTDQVPSGSANVWVHKTDYCRPGLGKPIKIPATDVALTMVRSARIMVTVDFAGAKRPAGYIVEIAPEGGNAIGSWGGSGNIDAGNQIMFRDVPPGRYIIKGRPNPSSENQVSKPVTIDIKGGQATRITILAK
jgi:hypothetical protein